jgi:hypothetical protein
MRVLSLRITDRTLGEVVEYLRQQSGANIVVMQGKDAKVSLDLTDVTWRDALEIAAEKAGCVVVDNKGRHPVRRTAAARFVGIPPGLEESPRSSTASPRSAAPTSSSHPTSKARCPCA